MEELIEFTKELLHNQPNTVIGLSLAILVILGIYIKLLDIYTSSIFNLYPFSNTEKIYPLSRSFKEN